MKLYAVHPDLASGYAMAALSESAPNGPDAIEECRRCGRSIGEGNYDKRLMLCWDFEPITFGDVLWIAGSSRMAVEASHCKAVAQQFPELSCKEIDWARPKRIAKRKNGAHGVKATDSPPHYVELCVSHAVSAFLARSTVREVDACDVCAQSSIEIDGIESNESRWDPAKGRLIPLRTPRQPGLGLYLSSAMTRGYDVFRFARNDWVLCTNNFRDWVQRHEITNIQFWECGEVVD